MTSDEASLKENAAATAGWAGTAAGVALIVAFRIPAFLEPRWYSDESVYAYVGRTIFGGGDLYTSPGAWDNKPPVQYWIYGILTHFLGYSEAALHLVPFASAIAAVIAVAWGVARLTGSRRRAVIACILAALIIGPPIFDSELFLPEAALIGPMTWAGMLMLVSVSSPWWAARHRWAPYVAAVLASLALGMQQTVIADVVAIGIIALIAGSQRWGDLLRFYTTGLAVTLLWLVPTVIASGLGATWFATVRFYQTYANNSVMPLTALGRILHFAGIGGGVAAIILGAALIARRTQNRFWMLWVLGGIDLLVAGSAHFPYPHLLLPSIPWVCAAVVATPWHRMRVFLLDTRRYRLWLGSAVLAAGLLLAAAEGSYAGSYWINGRSLSTYYVNGYASLVNASERTRWQDSFAKGVVVDAAVAHWLIAHHYSNATAVVWDIADEWIYLLTPVVTVLPTVSLFNDDLLLGSRSAIGPYVARHRPTVIVINQPSLVLRPSILPVLAEYYTAVYRFGSDTVYIERATLSRTAQASPLHRATTDVSGA
jgi:4-amino-4-deoxy-L-arabinose transferase-like glycosyltransferase